MRWRRASKRVTPVATETLRQSTLREGAMGMVTRKSQCSRVRRRRPEPSAPMTMPRGPLRSAVWMDCSASSAVPTSQSPSSFRRVRQRARLVTWTEWGVFRGPAGDAPGGVREIGGLVPGRDDGEDAGGVRRAHAGTQIVGILDAIENEDEGIGRVRQLLIEPFLGPEQGGIAEVGVPVGTLLALSPERLSTTGSPGFFPLFNGPGHRWGELIYWRPRPRRERRFPESGACRRHTSSGWHQGRIAE